MMNMIAQGSQNNPYHNKINSKMVARCMLFTYRVLQSISKHKLKKLDNWQRAVSFYKNKIYIATIFAIFNQYFQRSSLRFPHQIQRFRHIFLAKFSVLPFLFNNIPLPEKMNYQCDQGMLTALNLLEDQKTINQKKYQ